MEPGLASYTRKIVISPYVGGEGDYVISHIFKLAQIQVKMIKLYLALLLHWRSQGVWRGTPSPSVRHWHKILEKPYILAFFSGKENQHTPPLDHTAKGKLDPPLFFPQFEYICSNLWSASNYTRLRLKAKVWKIYLSSQYWSTSGYSYWQVVGDLGPVLLLFILQLQ